MASSAGLRRKRTDVEPVSQPGSHPSTNHLVVCGVTDVKSSWLFGDFLGFTTALREQAIHGTFLNYFDLDQYFASTPYNDIKFGRRWEIPDGEDWDLGGELAIYTRWDFEHRTRWWTQLTQHEAPNAVTKVIEWVARCTRTTGPGDVVSIILMGHGAPSGICLGGSLLTPESLANACSLLHPDVQVNIVVKCCYSGSFLQAFQTSGRGKAYVHTPATKNGKSYSERRSISGRFRNSAFGSSFVRTFGLMQDPEENWTLAKHGNFIKVQLAKTPVHSQPQLLSTSKTTTLMKDIICHEYMDVSFLNAPRRARRVITPPSIPQPPQSAGVALSSVQYEAACAIIEQEIGLIDADLPDPDDMNLTENWFMKWTTRQLRDEAMVETVNGLAFRFIVQERLFLVMEDLINQGLVQIDSLYAPMELAGTPVYSASVETIIAVLDCFTLGHDCLDRDTFVPDRKFESAIWWLAVVISRTCTNWELVVQRWMTFHLLGKPNETKFNGLLRRRLEISTNPEEAIPAGDLSGQPRLGFWLPHGTKVEGFVGPFLCRYGKMKHAYQEITGEGWPGDPEIENAMARLLAIEKGDRRAEPLPWAIESSQGAISSRVVLRH